jgi:3-oxoacyl-[acyl-carrier-protein] synthase II
MTLPRVVITGMGVVSPNGIGKEAFCRAILAGKSGVKRISRFDPSELPVHIAGEIPEFDELAWVDARERKHVSRVVPLAVAASSEAIQDAGLNPTAMSMDEKREIGVVLGTGGGAQEFSEEQYRLWHSGHVKQVSLFCIPSGTMGTIPSEISMRFGFRGYSHVVTAGCTSSTDALGYAYQHIQAGVQPMFLVGGVDSPITPERGSRTGLAAFFRGPRRIRNCRRFVDVYPRGLCTRPGSRRAHLRRTHGLRFHL